MKRSIWIWVISLVAIIFGVLTIISGGSVLFSPQAQQAAGNYVDFIVWFNFLTGFAYIAAGVGLWLGQRWAVWLSCFIAGAILVAFIAFGFYVFSGGSFEMRTVGAMTFRLAVWVMISAIGFQQLKLKNAQQK